MHFDTAMQIMDDLEDADLDIEPQTLDILTAELDDSNLLSGYNNPR